LSPQTRDQVVDGDEAIRWLMVMKRASALPSAPSSLDKPARGVYTD